MEWRSPLNVAINKLLTESSQWETVLNVTRDIGHLFDVINVATALHSLAKLSRQIHNKVGAAVVIFVTCLPSVSLISPSSQIPLSQRDWARTHMLERDIQHDSQAMCHDKDCSTHPLAHSGMALCVWQGERTRLITQHAQYPRLLEICLQQLPSFGARQTANTVWALAHLGHR